MDQHAGSSRGPEDAPQNNDIRSSTTKMQLDASLASASSLNETTKPNDKDNPLSLFNSTPPTSKYRGDPRTHINSQRTQESAIGHSLLATVENFADNYLRECDDYRKDLSDKHWKKFKEDIRKIGIEADMYPIAAKLLTQVCIAVCNPQNDSDSCLVVHPVSDKHMTGEEMEGAGLRPDLVFVWSTYATAKRIICPPSGRIDTPTLRWSDVVSYVEAKRGLDGAAPSGQASSYCHILPRAQPDHAGILYSAITPDVFFLYWADTSGIVRSHRYRYKNLEDWSVLFRYVSTLVKPLPELPTRDSTMEHNKDTNRWTIKCKDKIYKNCELIDSTCGQSRQTCVFLTEASPESKRIVKDLWFDEQRRFKEADLLEKIEGVPGVAQGDFSADVPGTGTNKLLQTSEMHSGPNSRLDPERKAPRRTKKRCILKSVGKKLKTRRSLLHAVKAIHDSLRAHQMCYKYKRILHRDVSRYNILIDPEHFDVKEFTTASEFKEAKFLGYILGHKTENKEDGMLIDWDTAADLNATDIGESLTHRTGTPIYVSRSISRGQSRGAEGEYEHRCRFPEMSDKAKALYISAFGEERYEQYRSAVNNSILIKVVEEDLELRHTGFHDAESFAWVLIHELLLAWPKDSADEGLNDQTRNAICTLENHVFGQLDEREALLNAKPADWKKFLHPQLSFLAPYIAKVSSYIRTEWAHWPELPEDHFHEALAIILLDMACAIEERGDIELGKKERGESLRAKYNVDGALLFDTRFEVTPLRSKKRYADSSQCRASKKSKSHRSTQVNVQARPSIPAKAHGSVHKDNAEAGISIPAKSYDSVHGDNTEAGSSTLTMANGFVREDNAEAGPSAPAMVDEPVLEFEVIQNANKPSRKKKTIKQDWENAQDRVYNGPMTRSRTNSRDRGKAARRL